jgi:hypothetical protein
MDGMNWFHLDWNENTVTRLQFHKLQRTNCLAEELLRTRETIYLMEVVKDVSTNPIKACTAVHSLGITAMNMSDINHVLYISNLH